VVDPDSPRPRLVSVGGDAPEPASDGPGAASDSETGPSGRRLPWLLAVLLVAAVAGLVVQGSRVQALQAKNAELSGELFTARSALDAYASRFAEVRQSIGGLQAQIAELEALVSADPLEAAGTAPQEAAEPPSEAASAAAGD
jgi:hypothetical protein